MKKSMLCIGLMAILCTTTEADNNHQSGNTQATQTIPTPATAVQKNSKGAPIPALQGTTDPQKKTSKQVTATAVPALINCSYRISAEKTHIEQALVLKWAEKAAIQSFDFDYNTIDKQLTDLKICYTEQGWQGFNEALQKSGNINAIKKQKLTVSSLINGATSIAELKDNQWKVVLPMQVGYQNEKDKITQLLTVSLIIGRKVSGDLGIMQMIATNHPSTGSTTAPAATPPSAAAAGAKTKSNPKK